MPWLIGGYMIVESKKPLTTEERARAAARIVVDRVLKERRAGRNVIAVTDEVIALMRQNSMPFKRVVPIKDKEI